MYATLFFHSECVRISQDMLNLINCADEKEGIVVGEAGHMAALPLEYNTFF